MKRRTVILMLVATLYGCGDDSPEPKVVSDSERAVDAAFKVCTAMRNTGLVSECEVKGWGSTIDARIDTSGSEARKMCDGFVPMIENASGNAFKGKWELRIFSPYSGDHPLATCTLH